MIRNSRHVGRCIVGLTAIFGIFAVALHARQQPHPPLPEGYVMPGPATARGLAPKMHVRQLASTGSRTFEVTFGSGDEIMSGLTEFAEKNGVTSGYLSGIGGLSTATLGWGDPQKGGVKTIPVTDKCELASLLGGISLVGGKVFVHAHAVVSFSDGSTKGGHLVDAHADPFVEVYVVATESPAAASTGR